MSDLNKRSCDGCNHGWGDCNTKECTNCTDGCAELKAYLEQNKKPRICDVLGLEVGERFSYNQFPHIQIWFDSVGGYSYCQNNGLTVETNVLNLIYVCINHPEAIIRRPMWTQQEIEDAKTIFRIIPDADRIERYGSVLHVLDADDELVTGLYPNLFPSLKDEQSARLSDILEA